MTGRVLIGFVPSIKESTPHDGFSLQFAENWLL